MATQACRGNSDLAKVEWLAVRAISGKCPYYVVPSTNGKHLVSTFGPGPEYLGRVFFRERRAASTVTDQELQQEARRGAATAVAVSAGLLAIALLSSVSWSWAGLGALAAGLSFSGIATLGQGLWQQTAALPFLLLGLAAAAHTRRHPALLIVAAGAVSFATSLRPAEAPLGLGIVLFAALSAREGKCSAVILLVAGIGALLGLFPAMVWNLWYFDTPWPVGQLLANARGGTHVFQFSPSHIGTSLLGLLVSPARGILWFAPVWFLGCWPRERRHLAISLGIVAELLLVAVFHKWWGGLAFGPRLLGLSVWVACFVAVVELSERRTVLAVFLGITTLIGLVGALRYDPRDWEIPRNPDRNPGVLFSVTDNPIVTMLSQPRPRRAMLDAPAGPFVYCLSEEGEVVLKDAKPSTPQNHLRGP